MRQTQKIYNELPNAPRLVRFCIMKIHYVKMPRGKIKRV